MSLFELNFSLTSVVLGLALAHIAAAMRRLLLAGRKVRWAPEPILLAAIILLVVTFVWLDQWADRGETNLPVSIAVLQVLKLLALYVAASSCLPDLDNNEEISLLAYYEQTRFLTFGALIVGLLLFIVADLARHGPVLATATMLRMSLEAAYAAVYALLLFVRNRAVNVGVLSLMLLIYGSAVLTVQIQ